MQEKCK